MKFNLDHQSFTSWQNESIIVGRGYNTSGEILEEIEELGQKNVSKKKLIALFLDLAGQEIERIRYESGEFFIMDHVKTNARIVASEIAQYHQTQDRNEKLIIQRSIDQLIKRIHERKSTTIEGSNTPVPAWPDSEIKTFDEMLQQIHFVETKYLGGKRQRLSLLTRFTIFGQKN